MHQSFRLITTFVGYVAVATPLSAQSDLPSALRRAAELQQDSLIQAIELLYAARDHADGDSLVPRVLLELGRLGTQAERQLSYVGLSTLNHRFPESFEEWPEGDWIIYNGRDLKEIIERFPESELVDDAAYLLTFSSNTLECEHNDVTCVVDRRFFPVARFLREYARSDRAGEAVLRANAAFGQLPDWPDLRYSTETYDADFARELLSIYNEIADALPPRVRPDAYRLIGDLWSRFHEPKRAAQVYESILRDRPRHDDRSAIEERIAMLRDGSPRSREYRFTHSQLADEITNLAAADPTISLADLVTKANRLLRMHGINYSASIRGGAWLRGDTVLIVESNATVFLPAGPAFDTDGCGNRFVNSIPAVQANSSSLQLVREGTVLQIPLPEVLKFTKAWLATVQGDVFAEVVVPRAQFGNPYRAYRQAVYWRFGLGRGAREWWNEMQRRYDFLASSNEPFLPLRITPKGAEFDPNHYMLQDPDDKKAALLPKEFPRTFDGGAFSTRGVIVVYERSCT